MASITLNVLFHPFSLFRMKRCCADATANRADKKVRLPDSPESTPSNYWRAPCESISGAALDRYTFGMELKYTFLFVAFPNNYGGGSL